MTGDSPDLPEQSDKEMLEHCCTMVCMLGMAFLASARKQKMDNRSLAEDMEGLLALISNTLTIWSQRASQTQEKA